MNTEQKKPGVYILVLLIILLANLPLIINAKEKIMPMGADSFQRPVPSFKLEKTYGGSNDDRGQASVFFDAEQTIISVGTTIEIGRLNTSIYVLKTTTNGSIVWERNYGSLSNNHPVSIMLTPKKEILICANSRHVTKEHIGSNKISLLRLDQAGILIEEMILYEYHNSYASSMMHLSDGSFIIFGSITYDDKELDEIMIIKLNHQLEIQWKKILAAERMISAQDMVETQDNYLYLMSTTYVGKGFLRILVQKVDFEGNILWSIIYGNRENYMGCSIIATNDNQLLLMGETDAYNEKVGTVLIKINSQGDILWERFHQMEGNTIGRKILETCNNGFLIGGATNISINDMLYLSGQSNGYLLYTDSYGNKLWEKSFGGNHHDFILGLSRLPDKSYLLTGRSSSFSDHGDMDLYLLHLERFSFDRPVVSVSPKTLHFGALDKSQKPRPLMLYIFNEGLGNLNGYITSIAPWIKTNDKSFIIPTYGFLVLPVYIDSKNIQEGSYSGQIQIGTNGGNMAIDIYCNIIDNSPYLHVFPESYADDEVSHREPISFKLSIMNRGRQNLFGSIESLVPWITISSTTFFSNEWEMTVTVDPSSLSSGPHQGSIIITSNGGTFHFLVDIQCKFPVLAIELFIGKPEVLIDGKPAMIDPGNELIVPLIINSRAIVPLRFFSEAFGAEVVWNPEGKTIDVVCPRKGIRIQVQVNRDFALVNEKELLLEVPPLIIQNRVFVPLRFFVEAFGAQIFAEKLEDQAMKITIIYEL